MTSRGNAIAPQKRLRVGYLTTHLSSSDGWGRYSRSLAEAVSEHADVIALTSAHTNETRLLRVRAVLPRARYHPFTQCKVAFQVWKYLRGCDVIHVLVEPYGPGAALAAHVLGIPLTMTLHGTYSVPPKRLSIKKLMMRYMYARMKIVTTGSVYTEKKVREVVAMDECRFIPNGVNLEKFRVLPGVKKEDMILTVGMLKPRKGADIVVRALALLKDEFPSLRYVIVGDRERSHFNEMVQALPHELGISGRVEFVDGISDDDLVRLYNKAKVFVLAARTTEDFFEGFPMVYYEANACGTPVVTTRGFGSEYAIHDGENGYLVDSESPESVAGAIRRILSDVEHYSLMSAHSREEAERHSWPNIVVFLLELYRDSIARTSRV